MATGTPLPSKEDLSKALWNLATTLSTEAQNAALKKSRELGYDLTKGRISLEETLINLNHARDVLIDVSEKGKLSQIPLKLQYTLFAATQRVSQQLTQLLAGTDAVLSLEDAVDDLASSIWQFNLENLSGEVLGFTQKMNQLKSQETLIRRVHREAEAFSTLQLQAQEILARLEAFESQAGKLAEQIDGSASSVATEVEAATKQQQLLEAKLTLAEEQQGSIFSHLTTSQDLESKIAELHEQAKEAHAEIENTRKETTEALNDWSAKYENLVESSTTSIEHSAAEARSSIDASLNAAKEEFDASTSLLSTNVAEMRQEVTGLMEQTTAQLSKQQKDFASKISEALTDFEENSSTKLAEVSTEFNRQAEDISGKAHTSVAENDAELKRLTTSLEDLESRIRESIERATGFTLFHSFQKRQLDLAESKKYWARMLAGAVAISLAVSGIFIWNLQYVHTYNAAFYMKLSISLPLIYAIAFCSVQYSRERRLEEEYAFKSSISISLEPYQKLVRGLVDPEKPEEMAKYTAFIIESVNRVFTSPTEHIFDDGKQDKNSTEKLIKALGEFIDPLVKIIKSK